MVDFGRYGGGGGWLVAKLCVIFLRSPPPPPRAVACPASSVHGTLQARMLGG